ncbi:MAG: hypothetical protein ACJ8GN_16290 [Longimicrobiaceae bacterium]
MRRRRLAGVLVIACAACSGDQPLSPESLPGEYALGAVGASAVPVTVYDPGGPRTYLGGTLTLSADQDYVLTKEVRRCTTACTEGTVVEHGIWSVLADGSLTFRGDNGVSDPPPLVLAKGREIVFCVGAAGEPCQPAWVFQRQ